MTNRRALESPCETFFFAPGLKVRLAHLLEIPDVGSRRY
jgi:hypothetical protein